MPKRGELCPGISAAAAIITARSRRCSLPRRLGKREVAMAQAQKEFSVVGKTTPRIDAYERVTGQAQYTGDIQLAGMLYARVLRSPHPHARIVSIDTSRAEKLPGVKAVIHHGNAQIPWSSGGHTHKRFIFNNPVRYVGDAVAAVAGTGRPIAE